MRTGAGPADYELKKNGVVVWSGRRSFTFWDAVVDDLGRAGGYAYSDGNEQFSSGDFIVAFLDSKGEERIASRTKRESSLIEHATPDPKARKLVLDAGNDRLIVVVVGSTIDRNLDAWWIYKLSNGVEIGRPSPRGRMQDNDKVIFENDIRPVRGTPLTLIHWMRYESGEQSIQPNCGARFTLVDLECRPVWTLELPEDYTIPSDEKEADRLYEEMRTNGAILKCSDPGMFELRHVKPSKRVQYRVEPDASAPSGWFVKEVSASEYIKPASTAGSRPAAFDITTIPELKLQHLGSVSLRDAPRGASPIHDIIDLRIDGRGRLGFLQRSDSEAGNWKYIIVSDSGELYKSVEVPPPPSDDQSKLLVVPLDGERRLFMYSGYGENPGSARRFDADKGIFTNIVGFTATADAAKGTPDGGFVILSRVHHKYTIDDSVARFDKNGIQLWRVGENSENEEKLFAPEDVTITSNGDVVVLENIRNDLKIHGLDGKYKKTIKLRESWGWNPNYPSRVDADANGGVVVYDFHGDPPIVHMSADGGVLAKFTPRFADGTAVDIYDGVQVSPDGRYWTTDRHSILQLDEKGVVTKILGEKPEVSRLREIARVEAGPNGNIYALDARTRAVHVFDKTGKPLFVCKPLPVDVDPKSDLNIMTISDSGEIYISRTDFDFDKPPEYLHFSAAGERIGVETAVLDTVSQNWVCQPGGKNKWVVGFKELFLVNEKGGLVYSTQERPDGNWIKGIFHGRAGRDGSLALLTVPGPFRGPYEAPAMHIYNSKGEPIRSILVPAASTISDDFDYDGKRIAVLWRSKTEKAVILYQPDGKCLGRFRVNIEGDAARCFLAPGGSELWISTYEGRIERYQMPEFR